MLVSAGIKALNSTVQISYKESDHYGPLIASIATLLHSEPPQIGSKHNHSSRNVHSSY